MVVGFVVFFTAAVDAVTVVHVVATVFAANIDGGSGGGGFSCFGGGGGGGGKMFRGNIFVYVVIYTFSHE